jgi:hypothetical protein
MTDKYTIKDTESVWFCAHCPDPEQEAKCIVELMNQAYEEGKKDMLLSSDDAVNEAIDFAYEKGKIDALKEIDGLPADVYLTPELIDYLQAELKDDR